MAISVARAHLAMAHAALPALLPTPPKCMMMPLLPTPQCALVILPMSPPKPKPKPKPSRADAVERWDAHKTAKPASPESSSGSGKSAGSSPGRASSCERWDSNKKSATSSSSSSTTSSSPSRASSGEKWGSNKRRPVTVSRASSAERWDAHKKPRPPQAGGVDDDGQSSTGSNDMELDDMPRRAFYGGPGFLLSPEPSMLPMPPSFMVRVAA